MTPTEKINKFIETVERVKSSRFVKETKNLGFRLEVEVDKQGSQSIIGADEEDMRSMLIDLRKLTLEKDDVYLPNIFELLISKTTNPQDREKLNEWKVAYKNFLLNPPSIPLTVNGKTDTVWDILEKWFYGHYFHEHSNHQSFLKSLNFGAPIHKFNFTLAITTLIKIAEAISLIARRVLDEQNTKI
jgi:hypothetical protein